MILISAKPSNGFWRCGVFHPSDQVEHSDDAFTPEQLVILKEEPLLSVFITTDENAATGDDEKKPKAKAE